MAKDHKPLQRPIGDLVPRLEDNIEYVFKRALQSTETSLPMEDQLVASQLTLLELMTCATYLVQIIAKELDTMGYCLQLPKKLVELLPVSTVETLRSAAAIYSEDPDSEHVITSKPTQQQKEPTWITEPSPRSVMDSARRIQTTVLFRKAMMEDLKSGQIDQNTAVGYMMVEVGKAMAKDSKNSKPTTEPTANSQPSSPVSSEPSPSKDSTSSSESKPK